MPQIPQKGWAALWVANGGAPSKADLASAVVMAESGGDSTSDSNPCCKGGYQINVEVGNTSRACAMSAVCSTRWAIKGSKNGKDWSQWEAYTNGSYRKFLGGGGGVRTKSQAKSVLASYPGQGLLEEGENLLESVPNPLNPLSAGPGGGITNPLDALSEIGDIVNFFRHAGELLLTEQGWLRIGKMLGGSILLLWGLRVLVREGTGADPVKTGKKLAETAAATAAVVK
jgi:hypothetical protein